LLLATVSKCQILLTDSRIDLEKFWSTHMILVSLTLKTDAHLTFHCNRFRK